MKIISGPASQSLSARVASLLGCELVKVEAKVFPDGEIYARVAGETRGEKVVIIQSTPANSDIVYLLQLIDACGDAKKVSAVIPYFGYARQDKKFQPGEAVSARAIAKTIDADAVYTINLHNESVLDFFRCRAKNLDASPQVGEFLKTMKLHRPIIIAPDGGAESLAKNVAAGGDWDVLEKKRVTSYKVEIAPKNLDAADRDVVIVDDIVSTGGTIAEAVRLMKELKARDIYVACVHPVLAADAAVKLSAAGVKKIIATDTIEKDVSVVSVAPLVADAVKK
jgi:ribose-phosphate pyrophosphokinase